MDVAERDPAGISAVDGEHAALHPIDGRDAAQPLARRVHGGCVGEHDLERTSPPHPAGLGEQALAGSSGSVSISTVPVGDGPCPCRGRSR